MSVVDPFVQSPYIFARRTPRNCIASQRMAAKSGEAFIRAETLAACRAVSKPRGFMQSAAPTIGEIAQPVARSIARSGSAVVIAGDAVGKGIVMGRRAA